MKRINKTFYLILIAVLALTLAIALSACGKNEHSHELVESS